MNIFLKRNVYFYEDYVIKKMNNYYIVQGKGQLTFKLVEEVLENLQTDIYKLGKTLFLQIENVSSFSKYLAKDKKLYKIRLLPFYQNKRVDVELNLKTTIDINLKSVNYDEDILFNNNGVIEIIDYLEILSNQYIQEIILKHFKEHGLPYHENVEYDVLQESLYSTIPMSINIRDLILSSITIYILTEIKKYLDKSITSLYIGKIMSLPDNCTKQDMLNKYKNYIDNFQEYYNICLSNYGSYTSPIQFEQSNGIMYIKSCNQIQAISYYFLTYILLGSFSLCCKCFLPTTNNRKGLCNKCYADTPNYLRNEDRKEQNAIAKEYITKLKNLNNDDINSKISEIDYNFHNPKEDKLFELTELFNSQNIK